MGSPTGCSWGKSPNIRTCGYDRVYTSRSSSWSALEGRCTPERLRSWALQIPGTAIGLCLDFRRCLLCLSVMLGRVSLALSLSVCLSVSLTHTQTHTHTHTRTHVHTCTHKHIDTDTHTHARRGARAHRKVHGQKSPHIVRNVH